MTGLPIVDVSALLDPAASPESCASVGRVIDAACRDTGFLLVTGHGIDPGLRDDLEHLSRQFFALPDATKTQIAMSKGGSPGAAGSRWAGSCGLQVRSPDTWIDVPADPYVFNMGDMLERMTRRGTPPSRRCPRRPCATCPPTTQRSAGTAGACTRRTWPWP